MLNKRRNLEDELQRQRLVAAAVAKKLPRHRDANKMP